MGSCRRTPISCRSVEDHGITFIGPSAEHIRIMGDKITAKETMQNAWRALRARLRRAASRIWKPREAIAADIGYPVIIKATAGGGGRGMKVAAHGR
jgi:acetyl-CoA carboxylase biotin carboxylase subunit